jgi:ABC-type antimicrobial peptide transport system permease subunit
LYGVLSYAVAQRAHEMGVRVALGAPTRTIAAMIVRQGVVLTAVGVAAGMVLAMLGGRRLAGLLYDTSPRDLPVMALAAVVLLASAVLAGVRPALRAGRVDPMRALKAD